MQIIYEDNHLLVLDKPAGLLTQPTNLQSDSLETRARAWIKETYQKPGNVFLHAAHRIDRLVSGIVVFAKTSKALSRLHALLRERKCKKIYLALVDHEPYPFTGTLEDCLVHDDYRATLDPKGKLARLHYIRIGDHRLEIDLETGRYHQIRAQLAAIGSPIKGDKKYGSRQSFRPDAIALHHHRLEILHPVKGEMLVFISPAPF